MSTQLNPGHFMLGPSQPRASVRQGTASNSLTRLSPRPPSLPYWPLCTLPSWATRSPITIQLWDCWSHPRKLQVHQPSPSHSHLCHPALQVSYCLPLCHPVYLWCLLAPAADKVCLAAELDGAGLCSARERRKREGGREGRINSRTSAKSCPPFLM